MQKEIHNIQAEILKKLLLVERARFTDLKPGDVLSDHFTFHIKQLLERGVIEKTEGGLYRLTLTGKEFANRFDTDSGPVKLEKQAKLSVLVIASRQKNRVREYAMQERLKQPFFGFRGFVTGKIKLGESVLEAGSRELEEEMGLRGDIHHKCVYHERIYGPEGDFLEDKYFFICTVDNAQGEIRLAFEGGRNQWVAEGDILRGNIFYDIADLLSLAKEGAIAFSEKSYTVKKY